MKKIQILISNYDDINNPYYAGGGAYSVHEVAKRLSKTAKVTVLTGKYPHSRNRILEGVTYKRIGVSFAGPKIGQLVFQLLLPFYVKKMKFDIWMESFTPPISTAFLQVFTEKPVIGVVHMLSSEDMQRKYKLPFHLVENLGLKTYKQFIVTSKGLARKIKEVNSNAHIVVIPNGVPTLSGSIKSSVKKEHILYMGRIEVNQKGIDLLLQAYKEIAHKTALPLVIAGSGEEKQMKLLQQAIKDEKLDRLVKVIGKVSGKKKMDVFEKALCLIVPSRFETFSVVTLEGLTYGIPVVTFDIAGLSWLPKNCSVKVKNFNTKKMAESILKIQKDHVMRKEMIRNGKTFTKNYNWDFLIQGYKDVTDSLYKKGLV